MGLIRGLLAERRARVTPPTSLSSPSQWLIDLAGGSAKSGVSVTPDTAMNYSAVFACVKILAETLASVPLVVWRRLERGRERDPIHPLYGLLHDAPNPEMTSFELREVWMAHLALRGNAYGLIEKRGDGRPGRIWPLRPDQMSITRSESGTLVYVWQPARGPEQRFPKSAIVHLRGISTDGVMGLSPITLAREAIGLGMAAEEYGARLFSNGTLVGSVLEHPNKLSDEAHKRLKTSLSTWHEGLSQAHRTLIAEEGMKWHQVGINPDDAQFLETRKFQVTEIARWFRVPPHMVADLDRATFSNIEHQSLEFVQFTMLPWFTRIEQVMRRDLFVEEDRQTHDLGFVVQGLLRGDHAARSAFYQSGIVNGWMVRNEARELEDLNPIDGLDEPLVPLNMVTQAALEAMDAGTEPAPPPEPDPGDAARSRERRAKPGGALTRRRLALTFRPLFRDAAARVVKREKADVLEAARKFMGLRDSGAFLSWVDDYYRNPVFIDRAMRPVLNAFGEEIAASALVDLGAEPEIDDEIRTFLGSVVTAYVTKHVTQSVKQIRASVRQNTEHQVEALEELTDAWVDTRAERIAARQTVQTAGAVARSVYRSHGVQRTRWVAFGENCEICAQWDGRTVSIEAPFFREGETIAGDEFNPMTTKTDILHPPLHEGCDCGVAPA